MPDLLRRFGEKLFCYSLRMRTQSRDFTIVSNNCWGADIYKALGTRYQTPFVGLFIRPDCYLKLLNDFRAVIKCSLKFKRETHYPEVHEMRIRTNNFYPIGCIGDDVEIHFMHYKSEAEATAKWTRRVQRVSPDPEKLFVKFCDTDAPSNEQLGQFDKLPFAHKVCFVGKPQTGMECAVFMREFESGGSIRNVQLLRHYRNYFDVAGWLNGGSGFPRWGYRLFAGAIALCSKGRKQAV
jgi:uncharacterized protein (DUF1919 family)